jgi:hypothetical protein
MIASRAVALPLSEIPDAEEAEEVGVTRKVVTTAAEGRVAAAGSGPNAEEGVRSRWLAKEEAAAGGTGGGRGR